MDTKLALNPLPGLPEGITSRTLEVRDLEVHILEAGPRNAPLILLLHGFPELAFSWRNVILPLANLGYHVVAPDSRGYGRTRPRDPSAQRPVEYEDDLRPYRQLNLVHDVVALVFALGHTSVAALIGHDFGSSLTGNCAFVRPDLFRTVVFMSAPYTGPLALPFASDPALRRTADPESKAKPTLPTSPATLIAYAGAMLAQLDPPRKHYMQYFCGPGASAEILRAPQGLHAFLRGYFHAKSGDWDAGADEPHPVAPTPDGLASLPHYYVMPAAASMADVARAHAPTAEEVAGKSSRWLPDADLGVYVEEYARTGFQGGLNWYRGLVAKEEFAEELSLFSGRKIEVPAMYLAGKKDWGVYQLPGTLDNLRKKVCAKMEDEDVVLVEGAGHWMQQEQAEEVVKQIKRFLEKCN
ncbi:alpha/beta-hydrolase [Ganoderma leucocontextum]|nr:alpha/beta-hydrolase [Ganoderma leucocontextum]